MSRPAPTFSAGFFAALMEGAREIGEREVTVNLGGTVVTMVFHGIPSCDSEAASALAGEVHFRTLADAIDHSLETNSHHNQLTKCPK